MASGFALAAMMQLGVASAATTQKDTAPVQRFADGSAVAGASSTLLRNETGATFSLHTRELAAGHTIMVWWVIFNHPENCSNGMFGLRCGEGDLFEPSVEASAVYGAGHVIGGSGVAGYGGWIGVAETDGALFGPGLLEPFTADIHLITTTVCSRPSRSPRGSTTSGHATHASTCSSRRTRCSERSPAPWRGTGRGYRSPSAQG